MRRRNLGRVTLAGLPFLIALLVDLILFAALRDRLPDRLASHFDAAGDIDGHVGRTWYVLGIVLALGVLGVLWTWTVARGTFHGPSHHRIIAGGYALAAFFGYVLAAVLFVNLDATEGDPAGGFPLWQLAAALGTGVLGGGLGLLLARLVPAPQDPRTGPGQLPGERIALADGEVAGWARSAGSWWLPLSTLALLAAAVVLQFAVGWLAAVPLLLLGLALLTFSRPCVTVDRRGLTVAGLLPWPRVRVPLERIESADSREVDALAEYGGWGYRIRPGRSGVIIRSGEAIVARLVGGRDFAVTVDDSATGAALLNTLADRQRAGR
ncbi:DUF1648 domain-containing protein [Streptomyces sp. NBC_00654]|uniref:DUF1648 domain-containing protein n=1 Tax=Streptomyces sp. NBC_00654 TaxID=2975799 RepID=UPI0022538E7E|nr:DUF1648 domain-containing protein [Streptomyces sp. NBC_00654]MCX4964738.1 DUF1648 domain-containing protein [Streptomyces sp. NBC_00654]